MAAEYWEETASAGRKVIDMEMKGLQALADTLGETFAEAIDILFKTKGKVIITGIGKSGHIGCKLAATFASTGTPSFFVHPSEASHGDLGMVAKDDTVIAISYSGESRELGDIVNYCRRFAIPLIAIASNPESTLAKNANVAVILPKSEEACSFGLAPTTSTTQTLALGDALAMVLLDKKGFSRDEFRDRHPGGKLGQILIKVKDLMHQGDAMPLIAKGSLMSEALIVMTSKGLGCIGVVDADGRLEGIITDGDLRRKMSPDLASRSVDEIMTAAPKTISKDALGAEALALMNNYAITSLFILEDGKPVGIVHVHDCMRAGVV
ncbi:MAG: KpsF/GutQ family sugar-phosphate isomerase [Alphaproteobacteria bacterium]|nr:KpsF/GutQ family sugar-phosphate isomerase [Alphaproteobacteria bacterium]